MRSCRSQDFLRFSHFHLCLKESPHDEGSCCRISELLIFNDVALAL
jgi:hypothetical protein